MYIYLLIFFSTFQGFLGGIPSSSFTQDITPIILAAHRDCYEIIKILLDRGDRIAKPHDVRCHCTECVTKNSEDRLNHSRSRINAYRALASPSLVALSSKDPILTAFELSWELKRLSRLENEFKLEYETLAKQCQTFATALLDQTRGSTELETILNHDANGPVTSTAQPGQGTEHVERMTLARLKLAIKYKQKKVSLFSFIKGLSYSYFNVFGILTFFLCVLPLHPYIPKIKNSDGGSTLISDILMQIVISPFSLEILRKLPSFVFFTTKSL